MMLYCSLDSLQKYVALEILHGNVRRLLLTSYPESHCCPVLKHNKANCFFRHRLLFSRLVLMKVKGFLEQSVSSKWQKKTNDLSAVSVRW